MLVVYRISGNPDPRLSTFTLCSALSGTAARFQLQRRGVAIALDPTPPPESRRRLVCMSGIRAFIAVGPQFRPVVVLLTGAVLLRLLSAVNRSIICTEFAGGSFLKVPAGDGPRVQGQEGAEI